METPVWKRDTGESASGTDSNADPNMSLGTGVAGSVACRGLAQGMYKLLHICAFPVLMKNFDERVYFLLAGICRALQAEAAGGCMRDCPV